MSHYPIKINKKKYKTSTPFSFLSIGQTTPHHFPFSFFHHYPHILCSLTLSHTISFCSLFPPQILPKTESDLCLPAARHVTRFSGEFFVFSSGQRRWEVGGNISFVLQAFTSFLGQFLIVSFLPCLFHSRSTHTMADSGEQGGGRRCGTPSLSFFELHEPFQSHVDSEIKLPLWS